MAKTQDRNWMRCVLELILFHLRKSIQIYFYEIKFIIIYAQIHSYIYFNYFIYSSNFFCVLVLMGTLEPISPLFDMNYLQDLVGLFKEVVRQLGISQEDQNKLTLLVDTFAPTENYSNAKKQNILVRIILLQSFNAILSKP